jgi:2-desacetyl-2-hydroxyethyl bacteriochlorophyllide A dehydrogenase
MVILCHSQTEGNCIMWTSTLDLEPGRVLLTRLLGSLWPGAYFSSFAPLRVQNLPRQVLPASRWVRVRNRLAGICGSDLHLVHADGDFRIAPAALPGHSLSYVGHEVVGEVVEISDEVQYLHVGDRVVLQYGQNCLSSGVAKPCHFCYSGNYNLCEYGTFPGPTPIGGGWSEEMLLHEQQLFRISPTLHDEQAVLLEPTAVALHAVLRRPPQAGERVLIIGAGTIGLLTLEVVRMLAPQAEICVLARHPFQIEQATRLGASHIIYPEDSYKEVQKVTKGALYRGLFGNSMLLGGFDVIYDTVGKKKTLHHALRWARAKASVVLVGVSLHMMHIDLTPIWYQEVNLLGSLSHGIENWPIGSQERRSTFSIAAELIEAGILHPERLITHRFALNQYRHALETAAGKAHSRSIKVVFDYSLQPASAVPNVRASTRLRRPSPPQPNIPPVDELAPPVAAQPYLRNRPPLTPLPEEETPLSPDPDLLEDTAKSQAIKTVTPAPKPVEPRQAEDSINQPAEAIQIPATEKVPTTPTSPGPLAEEDGLSSTEESSAQHDQSESATAHEESPATVPGEYIDEQLSTASTDRAQGNMQELETNQGEDAFSQVEELPAQQENAPSNQKDKNAKGQTEESPQ